MSLTVYIGSDHGGFNLKASIIEHLQKKGATVVDLGPSDTSSTDYPIYAEKVCREVIDNAGLGILICGSGIGMSMAANRFKHIRAALCTSEFHAQMSRRHNNANVLCMGERITGVDHALSIVDSFFEWEFEGGRHSKRIDLFD